MADELEPVVFEVLAEIASAQANLVQMREELVATAESAQESGAQMSESLVGVGEALTTAAATAADAGATVGASMGEMGSSFQEGASAAAESGAMISSSMSEVEGSLADAAGAAADSYGQISDAMNDVSSEAESAASSVDDASNDMTEAFGEVGQTFEATAGLFTGAGSQIEGSLDVVAAAAQATAAEVSAAEDEMAAAASATGDEMIAAGAKAREAGTEIAEGAHHGESALKSMAEAFALFEGFELLKDSVKDAMNAEGAMNILNTAVKRAGESVRDLAPEIAGADERLKSLGFTQVEANQGIARLTQMLGNSEQALRLSGLAADLARAKQIDYSAAIRTVGMAATGHVGLLARMGLQTKDAAGNTLSAKAAIDAMAKSFHGTAQAYGSSMAGKMQVFKADMEEARAKIGVALIPALEQLTPMFIHLANVVANDVAPALAAVAGFYIRHKKLIDTLVVSLGAMWLSMKVGTAAVKAFAVIEGVVRAATVLWKTVTGEMKVAQWELNAALSANPIGLVIAAIVALGLIFVYAWKHSETFRKVTTETWYIIERVTGEAVAAIINYYIRPLVTAYLWLAEKIVSAMNYAFGWIPGVGGALSSAQDAVSSFASATDSELAKWANDAAHWGTQGANAITDAHDKIKDATADEIPAGAYSTGLSNTVPGAKAKDKHKKTNAEILAEQRKHDQKMLDEAKAAAKKREDQLKAELKAYKDAQKAKALIAAQQKKEAEAAAKEREAALALQLAAMQAQFEFAEQRLRAQAQEQIMFVNGQLANVGLSMMNLGYAGGLASISARASAGLGIARGGATPPPPPPIVINVAGSVVTQQSLVAAVHQGLLVTQRTNASLGIKPVGA